MVRVSATRWETRGGFEDVEVKVTILTVGGGGAVEMDKGDGEAVQGAVCTVSVTRTSL